MSSETSRGEAIVKDGTDKAKKGTNVTQPEGSKVCDVREVASLLNVSAGAVYDAVKAGTFPIEALHVGRLIRFRRSDVNALVGTA